MHADQSSQPPPVRAGRFLVSTPGCWHPDLTVCQSQNVADLQPVLADLQAESADLDSLVSDLPDDAWTRSTPAEGWTIAHQIAHLAWTDRAAHLAITDPDEFQAELRRAVARIDTYVDAAAAEGATVPPPELLMQWRDGRADLAEALRGCEDGTKIAWFGPPMSATSMATARMMETWAHGQDIADALAVTRVPTRRLRHICHLGVRTRVFSYAVRGRQAPEADVHVALRAPDGETWTWGDAGAADRVDGTALDFCLVVTQRRPVGDTALRVTGAAAAEWMSLAQAFAGPPTATDPARASLPPAG
jgi:uncharacterized protein (TIGR03084 family)